MVVSMAFVFRLDGLGARGVGVVGRTPVATASSRTLGYAFQSLSARIEGPRHKAVQQALDHLCLQDADLQAERDGRRIVQLSGPNRY